MPQNLIIASASTSVSTPFDTQQINVSVNGTEIVSLASQATIETAFSVNNQAGGLLDPTATATYAEAYNRDPEFYDFTRSLKAYKNTFNDEGDILLIDPDSDYFKYLNKSEPE